MLVVFNDLQLARSCDHEAFGAFMKFLAKYKDQITHIVANGDISDFELQSKFSHSPEHYNEAAEEIEATRWVYSTISHLCPKAVKTTLDGNHEERWHNLSAGQVGLAEWVKTPADMFDFKQLGWNHLPYGKNRFYRWHNRIFFHGTRAGSKGNNAKMEQDDVNYSTTSGHCHRNEFFQKRDAMGRVFTSLGHAGFSRPNMDYVKKANSNMTQGFGIYFYSPKVGETIVPIYMQAGNPRFVYNGDVFDGKGFKIPTSGNKKDQLKNLF